MSGSSPSQPPAARIEAIATQWSLVQRAHRSGQPQEGEQARQALVLRYAPAIRKYLGALAGNDDDADELAQDILVKLLQGDFAGADPARGRFRDFLKTALRNQVRKRWEKEKRRKPVNLEWDALPENASGGPDPWVAAWRKQLLDQTWAALERSDRAGGQNHAQVLRVRTEFPDASSEELAAKLAAALGKPVQPATARQQVHRARQKFVELLRAEIADGLVERSPEKIDEEISQLGLSAYLATA